MVINIILSLILTLILELSISLILGIRGKDLLKIAFINVLTNVPLNIVTNLLNLVIDEDIVFYVIIPLLEVLVVIIEGNYFKKLKNSILSPFKLALFLNILSYGYVFVYMLVEKIIK